MRYLAYQSGADSLNGGMDRIMTMVVGSTHFNKYDCWVVNSNDSDTALRHDRAMMDLCQKRYKGIPESCDLWLHVGNN